MTKIQILYAKRLRMKGKSNREIAKILNLPKTTVWENVYRIKKEPISDERCNKCECLIINEVEIEHIGAQRYKKVPHNFKLGNNCLKCIMKDKDLTRDDLLKYGYIVI